MGLSGKVDNGPVTPRVVAIVPAKLTSVRLPRKNVADLCGNPLFFYSVRAAQLCPSIDAVYVSSEAPELLEIAAGYGAETIVRPDVLSAAEVTNLDVLCHALDEIRQRNATVPDLLVLLQPTHPLRRVSELEEGIRRMGLDEAADILLTVVQADELRGVIRDGRFVSEFPMPRDKAAELKYFRNTGSFYIFRVARTLSQHRMFTDSILPLELERPEFEIDIDEASDLALARCLLQTYREEFSEYFREGSSP